MRQSLRIVIMGLLLVLLISQAVVAYGQEGSVEALTLRLRRNLGYGLGSQMQGAFTIQVEGPPTLNRVEFLLDGKVIGEDVSAPYSLKFNTRDYPEGVHKFSAVGYVGDGIQLQSEPLSRQFVATSSVTVIVVAIVALVIAFRVGSHFLTRRSSGNRAAGVSYGFLGGAICPNCGKAFGIHWWSLRLGLSRYDRCPHCSKWNMVQRAPTNALMEAEERFEVTHGNGEAKARSEEEAFRQRLEDSKFDEG